VRRHPRDYIAKPIQGWFSRSSTGDAADWVACACTSWVNTLKLYGCVATEKTAGIACSSVKLDEAREWIWPIPT
jgi:hypothetical protein